MIHETRLKCEAGPQLEQKMCKAGAITLGQLVNVCGPLLDDAATLDGHVGERSVRVLNQLLGERTHCLATTELALIVEFCEDGDQPITVTHSEN